MRSTSRGIGLTALSLLMLSPIAARADLLQYSYTGAPYTLFDTQSDPVKRTPYPGSPYSAANNITGTVVIDTGDQPITAGATYGITTFALTDGITTYSGPDFRTGVYDSAFGSLQLNTSGDVTQGQFAIYKTNTDGFTRLFLNSSDPTIFTEIPTASGDIAKYYAGGGAFLSSGLTFEALSEAPGTWSGPSIFTTGTSTSDDCSLAIQNAVGASVSGAIFSVTNQPISISADFTPHSGSLSSAAAACGVVKFNWQQTVTNFPTPDLFQFPLLEAPFLDPQPGGYGNGNYFTYCNRAIDVANPADERIIFSNPSTAFNNAYPFYYQSFGPPGDCFSQSSHEEFGSKLTFYDSPSNPLLKLGDFMGFTTCLVGVDGVGNAVSFPADYHSCFKWTDTYTGLNLDCPVSSPLDCRILDLGQGGIPWLQFNSDLSAGIPGRGYGGITIIDESLAVPEPSSSLLLIVGILSLFWRRHWWINSYRACRSQVN